MMQTLLVAVLNVALVVACATAYSQTEPNSEVSSSSAKAGTEQAQWHNSYELFQMLLEQEGLTVTDSWQSISAAPEASVLVLLGNLSSPVNLQQFVQSGGAVLLASDRTTNFGRQNLIASGPVRAYDQATMYQGHNDCVQVTDLSPESVLTKGVKSLVLNRSGTLSPLRTRWGDWQDLAKLPRRFISTTARGKPVIALLRPHVSSSGRLIAVADHSLFSNGMLWHGGNSILAINLSQFLSQGNRTKLLFAVDGSVRESFRDELAKLPPPSPPAVPPIDTPQLEIEQMLSVANRVVAKIEDADLHNAALVDRPRRIPTMYYQRGLLFALAGLLLIVAAYQLSEKPVQLTRPLPAPIPKTGFDRQWDAQQAKAADRTQIARQLAQGALSQFTGEETAAGWKRVIDRGQTNQGQEINSKQSATLRQLLDISQHDDLPNLSRGRLIVINELVEDLLSAGPPTS